MFPQLFNTVAGKNRRVREFAGTDGWRWHSILQEFTAHSTADQDSILALKDLVSTFNLSARGDEARWRWCNSGIFTVKSLYNFIQKGGVTETRFLLLWKNKLPLKVKIFGWLVLLKKVLTRDNLAKRGWSGVDTCSLCLDEAETIEHLFMNCYVTRALLGCLLPNKGFLRACMSIDSLWNMCCGKRGVVGRKESAKVAAVWWVIWLERNRRTFDNKKLSIRQLLADIRSLSSM
uniref:Reverse transcriptase zinc-binding domain-containing protein n=1 Tax=Ananas comosus var. bracteatus TaxID=296719 RepID=A0A6V7NWC0_ANACO|nr:unnamed protein product [Ananas comosus var. bracteatus]